jgi:hypothetical protein
MPLPLDARDNYGQTPLGIAVLEENEAVVDLLVEARADPNSPLANFHGHDLTPLTAAVRLNNAGIVKKLLAAPGIDLYQESMFGVPLAEQALAFARTGPIYNLLLAAVTESEMCKKSMSGDLLPASAYEDTSSFSSTRASTADSSSDSDTESSVSIEPTVKFPSINGPDNTSVSWTRATTVDRSRVAHLWQCQCGGAQCVVALSVPSTRRRFMSVCGWVRAMNPCM